MLDDLNPGVDSPIDRTVVIGVRHNVRAVVFRDADNRLHLFERQLRHVQRIELARDAATGHDLDLGRSATEIGSRRPAGFRHTVHDVHGFCPFQSILIQRLI